MNNAGLSRIAGKAAGPVGLIGAVGGFIADVLAPLGDFAPAVAGLSLIAAIIFGLLTIRESRNNRHDLWDTAYSGGLFVSISSIIIFSIWSLILSSAPERGYLAENIDPIAQIQGQLLGIQEDVTEIKETTEETAENVEAMATAQAQGFADIQAAFANLQQNQTIVDEPTTPQEYYSNARLYQLRGNTTEAVNAYEGYLQFGLEYVDPIQDYADLLKATEGISRAREIIAARQAEHPDSLVTEFVAISMLESVDERLTQYEALTKRAPQFGPGFLGWGQALETKLMGSGGFRLLTEQLIESYTALRELENNQNFTRYYIDKTRAVTAYDLAMRTLDARIAVGNNNPLLLQPEVMLSYTDAGVSFLFIISDLTREIFVSFDDPDNLRSTGVLQTAAGNFANSNLANQPIAVGDHIMYYKYVDGNGAESEVFEYPFTVHPLVASIYVQPADFTTGKSSALVQGYAYQRGQDEPFTFYWGLSEDDVNNDTGMTDFYFTNFTIPDLDPGDYTLYLRADGPNDEELGPYAFPFTVQ